jgi:hypothetical protein
MCKFKSSPSEIEYSSGYNVIFLFCRFFYVHIFLSIFTLHNIFFIFSNVIMHNLTFSFVVVDLQAKLSFSRKFCSSKKQLYYVVANKIPCE